MHNEDRKTLEAVAKGYHDLMKLHADQRKLQAKMIRTSLAAIKRQPRSFDDAATRRRITNDRAQALDGLASLAEMLDPQL